MGTQNDGGKGNKDFSKTTVTTAKNPNQQQPGTQQGGFGQKTNQNPQGGHQQGGLGQKPNVGGQTPQQKQPWGPAGGGTGATNMGGKKDKDKF